MYYGPRTITNGLVLALDAADKNSYKGSGTTWTDLSGNGYNGTLTNSPTFSNSNGGSIIFDGTNDYTSTSLDLSWNNTNSVSISMWIKTGNLSQSKGFLGTGNFEWQFRQGQYAGANSDLVFVYWDNSGGHTNGSIPSMSGFFDDTNWKHLTMTWNNSNSTILFYKNGTQIFSQVYGNPSANRVSSELMQIGGNVYSWDGVGAYWNGSFSNIQTYNRTLSATEVLQNYNATKTRFGL
jgi:hypothetical protein